MARHRADITLVDPGERARSSRIYFETTVPSSAEALEKDLAALPIARRVTVVKTFQRIYGKRIIIVGGGAQVGQVALGAISEADRHNIRGEHISVDTIPLVESRRWPTPCARWRAAAARVLVLAGASWAATSRRRCARSAPRACSS
jgi:energy-converting hydrogenase B subunit Q